MENYIGITFGPITRITEAAKSTKALWGSSYFFSYLAQNIISEFKKRTFIYPVVDKEELWNARNGIGCFPDRYVFQAAEEDFKELTKKIDEVLNGISNEITKTLNEAENNKEKKSEKYEKKEVKNNDVLSFLQNYIKIYCLEKEPECKNIANEFNSIFDFLEMQDVYNLEEKENYLLQFLESKELYNSFLAKFAFDKNEQYFDAIDSIADIECKGSTDIKPMAYHQYIAVISADGDNMTSTINSMSELERSIADLSEQLFAFGQATIDIAADYGARIIFSGGDDLLIFSPLKYKGKTVFDLVEKISEIFNEKMKDLPSPPTISFGIAISYVKFPMGEALAYAREQLSTAKKGTKNSVVSRLHKHSGQTSILKQKKNKGSYQKALQLIRTNVGNELFLNSLTYWFEKNMQILTVILSEEKQEQKEDRMKIFLSNSLNEDIHKEEKRKEFIQEVGLYLCQYHEELQQELADSKNKAKSEDGTYSEVRDSTNSKSDSLEKQAIDATVSLLRLIHFINTKRHE